MQSQSGVPQTPLGYESFRVVLSSTLLAAMLTSGFASPPPGAVPAHLGCFREVP
jgi:hypothetical protein